MRKSSFVVRIPNCIGSSYSVEKLVLRVIRLLLAPRFMLADKEEFCSSTPQLYS